MCYVVLMLFGGGGVVGIFSDDQVKIQFSGVVGGGFDVDVGGDVVENDGVDFVVVQLKFKVGVIECVLLVFGYFDIVFLFIQCGWVGLLVFGQCMCFGLSVDRLFQCFGEIG